jgi:hypothetical protein
MQKKAKEEIEKRVQQIIKTFKTKEAIAEHAVMQESGFARSTWLYETAYNMLTPEQKAKFDKIAQST